MYSRYAGFEVMLQLNMLFKQKSDIINHFTTKYKNYYAFFIIKFEKCGFCGAAISIDRGRLETWKEILLIFTKVKSLFIQFPVSFSKRRQ